MMRWVVPAVLMWLSQASCTHDNVSPQVITSAEIAVKQCVDKLIDLQKESTLVHADHAYVDVFENGYTVGFSHGAVGSFGPRNPRQRSVWVCGVTTSQVVLLVEGAVSNKPVLGTFAVHAYENYEEDVIEVLFLREGDSYRFHDAQLLDEKNLLKHNPDLYKPMEYQQSDVLLTE